MGIISYCNYNIAINSIIEIGAGTGDIIRNINSKHKIALDQDSRVLKAAKILNYLNLQFNIKTMIYEFPNDELNGKYDCIIMVNWIHHIPPDILKFNICKYYNENLNFNGSIIIDTVNDSNYKFNHNIDYLTSGLNTDVQLVGSYLQQRNIWALQKSI